MFEHSLILRQEFENNISWDGKQVADMIDELLDTRKWNALCRQMDWLNYGQSGVSRVPGWVLYNSGVISHLEHSNDTINSNKRDTESYLEELESNVVQVEEEIKSVVMLQLSNLFITEIFFSSSRNFSK